MKGNGVKYVKSSVFWVVTQCRLVKNRRFGTTYRSHLQGLSVQEEDRETTGWNYTGEGVDGDRSLESAEVAIGWWGVAVCRLGT
jgi:hypothetical protein